MRNAQHLDFFFKFKEKNSLLYSTIRDILYNFKYESIIYFDQIDLLAKNILNQYNLIERLILIKHLISEMNPELVKQYEIFPNNISLKLSLVKTDNNKNQKYDSFYSEQTTMDVLNQIENSEGDFKLYKKNRG